MYIIVENTSSNRMKFLIDALLLTYLPNGAIVADSNNFDDIEPDINRPVIILGKELFTKLTGDVSVGLGESLWSEEGVRFIPNYSLEQLHSNANLFYSFWQHIHIPFYYHVNKPDLDSISNQVVYDIPDTTDFKSDIVAFDIESAGLNSRIDRLLLIQISDGDRVWIIRPSMFIDERLRALLTNKDIKWLGHNGKFDVKYILNQLGIRINLSHDAMLLHYVLDERKGTHGLKTLTAKRFGLPDYESELKPYRPRKDSSYALIPTLILEKYGAIDVLYTRKLFTQLWQEVIDHEHSSGLQRAYKFVMQAQEMYTDVELNGIYVDIEQVNKKEAELTILLSEARSKVISASGISTFNPNSSQQVSKYVYDSRGYKNPKTSKNKKPRTSDAKTILGLLDNHPDDELLQNLIASRQIKKMLSTYILPTKNKIDSDGRVRANFNVHGTETGRPSCREPNLQNIPRQFSNKYSDGIRKMFASETGKVLIQLDFKSAELRVACILSQDNSMKEIFDSGADLHRATAIDMFKIPSPTDEERSIAKTMNFRLLYGGTKFSIAQELKISTDRAQFLKELWFRSKPKLNKWLNETVKKCSKSLEIVMRSGRIRRIPPNYNGNYDHVKNQIMNTEIQSLASDACVLSAIWINKWLKRRNLGKLVLTVHDNVVLECDVAVADKVAKTCLYIMQRAGRNVMQSDYVPMLADKKVKEWLL